MFFRKMRRGDMHVKTVCTNCGEICRTGSIKNFRHCGIEQNVKANLLAGEEEKFKKLVAKKTGKAPEVVKPASVETPVEKIVEKVEKKHNETPAVEPIIEEKPEPPVEKVVVKKKRKKKSEIVEKKEIAAEDVYSFGFFE